MGGGALQAHTPGSVPVPAAAALAAQRRFCRTDLRVRLCYWRIGDDHVKLKLDLHDIYNQGKDIDRALRDIMDEAVRKKAPLVEIIPGKGSGQLKKRVLRFLEQKEIKELYHRVEKDSKNFGRVFVHFRH
jgi:DNA-nicking Smr family endonuclease